ncbi:GMC oxidoreductase [Laetiporus sulphureus 93-53]|uniref:GMC oxidoreductase n=1 Tax=Laetiporus sulphureus 93-53 TaxID=1314785 RepID=A0A165CRI5_9APHY|nr:GMC oxidoreductase [Laetiporus sulphureus 93-53]KZT03299.1 GMC oxidoreductase [Laetiporus sulphureus 93-53]
MSPITTIEVDVIIAGGGTSGCVIASRLAAADPCMKILLLEAGPPTLEDLAHVQPARYLSHLLPGSSTVKFNIGKESPDLEGRSPIVPCGQCLGGGSSVNFAMYARPSPSDYDDWEKLYGNDGWSSKDLIPLSRKMETYQITPSSDTHGDSGPIKVSYGGIFANLGQQFLDVAAGFDKSRSFTDDTNGMRECNAYGRWQKYIGRENGRRSDVPHNYIYNRSYQNLEILTGYRVKRVIFEGNRATGVEYLPDNRWHPDLKQDVLTARARRLVVVSAGAFGSPAILERSGVGSESLLRTLGTTTLVDLPGVGENYQDHNVIFVPYIVDSRAETLDGIVRNDPDEIKKWSAQWLEDGTGLMASNAIDAGAKLRPSVRELETIGPEFRQRWEEHYANAPDKPLLWFGVISMFVGDPSTVPVGKYMSMSYFLEYPASIGYVHITSGEDVAASPDFDPRYLSRREDLVALRWGYKHGREFARRMPFYRGEYVPGHPAFPEGSRASCLAEALPVDVSESSIEYTREDDEAIDNYTRKVVATAWHSLGTCAMKPREMGGVVDSHLNVYGIKGLKVADMSIAPSNVSANTYSTALVIGEKAACIILEELGIDTGTN